MNYLYISVTLFLGLLLPLQVGINTELARFINSPVLAAFVSFAVGSICLLASAVLLKIPLPAFGQVAAMPVWVWGGGLIGAAGVLGAIIVGPKIGVLALFGTLLIGQLIASLFVDHFGWLGFPIQKMNVGRLFGVLLLVGGFFLIRKN